MPVRLATPLCIYIRVHAPGRSDPNEGGRHAASGCPSRQARQGPRSMHGRVSRFESVRRIDAALPVEDLKTMTQQLRESIVLDRIVTALAAVCAGLAMLLAGVGLYGVLAYSVPQRTPEFGLRMALGASGREVWRMVVRQVARMLVVGAAIGIAAAFVLGRYAEALLYQLDGRDPVVFSRRDGVPFAGGVLRGARACGARVARGPDACAALRVATAG